MRPLLRPSGRLFGRLAFLCWAAGWVFVACVVDWDDVAWRESLVSDLVQSTVYVAPPWVVPLRYVWAVSPTAHAVGLGLFALLFVALFVVPVRLSESARSVDVRESRPSRPHKVVRGS